MHVRLKNVSFVDQDVYDLDLPPASFDFACMRLVLEHLVDPSAALRRVASVLRPGGILCAVDTDIGWVALSPEPPALSQFLAMAADATRAQEGDPYFGRKLFGHFHKAGFVDLQAQSVAISSHVVGMLAFFELLIGFRRRRVPKDKLADTDRLVQEIQAVGDEPGAWGALAGFVVSGRRPA